jgi:hypothetical protein
MKSPVNSGSLAFPAPPAAAAATIRPCRRPSPTFTNRNAIRADSAAAPVAGGGKRSARAGGRAVQRRHDRPAAVRMFSTTSQVMRVN